MTSTLDRVVRRVKGDTFADVWKVHQYSLLAQAVAPHISDGATVLDFGCGDGLFSVRLSHALPRNTQIIGIDLTPHSNWTRHPEGVHYLVGDARRPPLRPGSVKTVVAKDLLHHVADPNAVARLLLNVAGDALVIIEANANNPVMAFYTRHNKDQHFVPADLLELLRGVSPGLDWEVAYSTAYPFYLPPVAGLNALWVWPLTGLMLLTFKVLKIQRAARFLGRAMQRLGWPPPFVIATTRVHGSRGNLPA